MLPSPLYIVPTLGMRAHSQTQWEPPYPSDFQARLNDTRHQTGRFEDVFYTNVCLGIKVAYHHCRSCEQACLVREGPVCDDCREWEKMRHLTKAVTRGLAQKQVTQEITSHVLVYLKPRKSWAAFRRECWWCLLAGSPGSSWDKSTGGTSLE